jgi:hypothetical protein
MDQRPASPDGVPSKSNAVVPWTRPEPPAIGLTGFLRRATDLGLGAASIATSAAVDAIERFVPGEPADGEDEVAPPGVVRLVPGALMGAGLVAQRRMLDVSARVEKTMAQVAGTLSRTPFVGAPVRATEDYLGRWSDLGEVEQARNRALVTEFVRRLAPELATAVIAQLDMDSLMSQLPIDSIVAKVNIDALLDNVNVEGIIDRVDVEKIIDRVDVEKIIDRVDVEKIIDRVDVDKIIERVDINGIVGRVDMQGIMGKIDIAPMAQEIIAEVDIGAIVRQSTGSITGDAVDGGRVTAMRLDSFVDRVTDRILFRRKPRNLEVPGWDPYAKEEDQ